MANLLLIHGSWHGAWCWEAILPGLEAGGHRVRAIDLPGHGDDPTPVSEIELAAYVRRIREAASDHAPVVAVGHSMGGLAITAAAAAQPAPFAALLYVCAFVPTAGDSLVSLAQADPGSELAGITEIGSETIGLRADRLASAFYGECSEGDAQAAIARLRPEPLRPALEPVAGNVPSSLPRAYVECTRDRAIPIDHQRRMRDRTGVEPLASLDTDHSPFLSRRDELLAAIDSFARRFS